MVLRRHARPAARAPQLLLNAYNYARRLKTLRGLTPYEFICQAWVDEPERFTRDPTHHTVGPSN
jgi:hypothetical protein